MKVHYGKDLSAKRRKITVELTGEDVAQLPETMRQEFVKAEVQMVLNHPAQLIGLCARMAGMRPTDPQSAFDLDDLTNGERD